MIKLNNKYVIGTHVMFFEIEMYKDFIDGLVNLLQDVSNKNNVTIDLCFNLTENVEKIDFEKTSRDELLNKFHNGVDVIRNMGYTVKAKIVEDEFYFHTDYRRDLNYNYCKKVDYVMWGETDSFFPKEAFQVIETLSEYTNEQNIHRYLLSFADRKMWDSSWDPLVHVDYKDVVFEDEEDSYLNPNQAKSPMSIKKMNEINAKSKEFNFTYITKPKISGACLVLSSDLIKCGVNVPPCLLYNDDEGLSIMAEKVMSQGFIQFICDNILHVHARRHPNKRLYVKSEDNPHSFISEKNEKFQKLLELSRQNIQSLITGKNKFFEYKDLKNILETMK
tara:strand:+ start:4098 stop:5099 length:1002 start_codon:yes stop_codon:yes gene_type:complete